MFAVTGTLDENGTMHGKGSQPASCLSSQPASCLSSRVLITGIESASPSAAISRAIRLSSGSGPAWVPSARSAAASPDPTARAALRARSGRCRSRPTRQAGSIQAAPARSTRAAGRQRHLQREPHAIVGGIGTHTITAGYGGDPAHVTSSGGTQVSVTNSGGGSGGGGSSVHAVIGNLGTTLVKPGSLELTGAGSTASTGGTITDHTWSVATGGAAATSASCGDEQQARRVRRAAT
jgi:hypothetical protein